MKFKEKIYIFLLQKTTAYRRYKDDVPEQIKKERHSRLIQLYRKKCQLLNDKEIGKVHLVLVESVIEKTNQILGRNEFYIKVLFNEREIDFNGEKRQVKPGDYVSVRIVDAKSSVLYGKAVSFTSLREFYKDIGWADRHMLEMLA